MNFVNVGNGGFIPVDRIVAVFEYDTHLVRTRELMREKKNSEKFIDFTGIRACKSLILLSTGDLVGSLVAPETIVKRLNESNPDDFLVVYRFCCVKRSEIILITDKTYATKQILKIRKPTEIKLSAQNNRSAIWTSNGYVFYSAKTTKRLQEKVDASDEKWKNPRSDGWGK